MVVVEDLAASSPTRLGDQDSVWAERFSELLAVDTFVIIFEGRRLATFEKPFVSVFLIRKIVVHLAAIIAGERAGGQ
jgi:hypothetical protein